MALDIRDRRSPARWAALLATGMLLAATILASAVPVTAKPAGTVDFWLTVLHNNDGETPAAEQRIRALRRRGPLQAPWSTS
jgi:hypothetical protein